MHYGRYNKDLIYTKKEYRGIDLGRWKKAVNEMEAWLVFKEADWIEMDMASTDNVVYS